MNERHYTIGFSNLSESIPFAVTVRRSLEAAAAQYPNITLVCRDNDMDNDRAASNAREFADMPVDLAIIYHIDERASSAFSGTLMRKGIRIIAVDIPISLATFFGVNNKLAGQLAGQALGNWIQRHWNGQVDKVLVMTEPRVLDVVKQRVDYALVGLKSLIRYAPGDVLYVDSGNDRSPSAHNARSVLERWTQYHRIAVVGFNDDAAMGVLDAARALGREEDVAIVGQGASLAPEEFQRPGSRMIASTAYFPDQYGERLMEVAWRILHGERVPRENFVDPVCLTAEDAAV